jgi:hypothetical protein
VLTSSAVERGVEGNARLTATTAVVLLVLLAIEGVTILSIGRLLSVHVFVGMLLIPPVALKLGATGWRFFRYYAGDPAYQLKGPPGPFFRFMIAPAVVLSTLVLFGTGVALLVVGHGGLVLGLHKASFVVWLVVTGVHVLAYVLKLPGLVAADWRGPRQAAAGLRLAVVAGALGVGFLLAATTVRFAHNFHHERRFRDGAGALSGGGAARRRAS